MNISLKEKNALVCGSTQGIGKAIAIELASLGTRVTLFARNEASLMKVVKELSTSDGQNHDYLVADFFAHSGTTLIAAEKLGRRCITFDRDPVFAELTIRRLERYRKTGKTGWQWKNPFPEVAVDSKQSFLSEGIFQNGMADLPLFRDGLNHEND